MIRRAATPAIAAATALLWTGLFSGCLSSSKEAPPEKPKEETKRGEAKEMVEAPPPPPPAAEAAAAAPAPAARDQEKSEEGRMGRRARGPGGGGFGVGAGRGGGLFKTAAPKPASSKKHRAKKLDEAERSASGEGDDSAPTRAWFPETFLFEPLLVTDEQGKGSVGVKVPDRLTTWRVLALAHSRQGAQAGAVTRFLGTLPVYVDMVVPPFLRAGDTIKLPLQVVNTTAAAVTTDLHVEVEGATVDGTWPKTGLTVAAAGNHIEPLSLSVPKAGQVTIKARAGKADALVRTFQVKPSGRPVTDTRSGTLAAPRALEVTVPPAADPATQRLRLQVYPGPLALLRNELSVAIDRGGAAEDAYALHLAGHAAGLLGSFGDHADPEVVEQLSMILGQRVLRHGRTFDIASGALLAQAAMSHPQSPVLARLGERLMNDLMGAQRPDGTFGGGGGVSLQRVLVTTAEATRAVLAMAAEATPAPAPGVPRPPREEEAAAVELVRRSQAVAVRSQGAFERHLALVDDPYTAAAILASGVLKGAPVDALRARVRKALKPRPDGSQVLEVSPSSVRADGRRPTEIEATALAILALEGDSQAPLGPMGAAVLGAYSPFSGWGDGRANFACLLAVLHIFKDPLPPRVKVIATLDDQPVLSGELDRERVREVLALEGPIPAALGAPGKHRLALRSEPAVPGLAFAVTLSSFVPWEKVAPRGVELDIGVPPKLQVGVPVEVELRGAAPAGHLMTLRHALPAGVQPDTPSLTALKTAGRLLDFTVQDGAVVLSLPSLGPGQTLRLKYRVVPTLSGTLNAEASSLTASGTTFLLPPTPWTVP
jgi:hypothetical protein